MRRSRQAGFTLIEVIGAFFLTVVVLFLVTGIFAENGRQRAAAIELMRERLAAAGALDLIASDLEGTIHLARRAGQDPEDHAWRFLAEGSGELGATALRFVTQNAPRSNAAEHATSWVEVAYFLDETEDGELVLWRWRSPRPPSRPARGFPSSDEVGAMRITSGISDFGIRFLDAEGSWLEDWDSTFEPPEAAIPEAAEISLALYRKPRRGEAEPDVDELPGLLHTRRVALAMRPIDVAALIELGRGDEENEADCYTIGQCLTESDSEWYTTLLEDDCEGDDALCDLLESPDDTCFSEIESSYPQIADQAPAECSG
ncbi:MAG: hypothetical protein CL908_26510 [Deltaproteobacteria bacterium]|nr:hypothetical protein [Deltaproteobacteria bacterium]